MRNGFMILEPTAGNQPPVDIDFAMIIILVLCAVIMGLLILLVLRQAQAKRLNRRIEQSTIDAREHADSIAMAADLILTRFDSKGRCIQLGAGLERLTGITTESLLEDPKRLLELVHHEDHHKLEEAEQKRSSGCTEPFELTYRIKGADNQWHWLLERQNLVVIDGVARGFESVSHDVSDRVRFEQQQRRLLDLERLSTTFLESFLVTDDVPGTSRIMLDVLGRYFDFSGAKLLERTEDGSTFQVTYSWRHESHRDRPSEVHPDTINAERITWWIEQVRGGVPFPISPENSHSSEESAVHEITGAESILVVPVLVLGRLHMMIVLEDQDQQRDWQPEELASIQTMSHGISRSIERNLAEQGRVEFAEYRRLIERTEIIGQLASGIAHDFNNILFAISGRTQLLLRHTTDEKVIQGLQNIDSAMADAKGIIGTLRIMNKKEARSTGIVSIAAETRRVTEMISRLIPNRVELKVDIKVSNDVQASCSPDALHQVVMNLLINARDAVEGQGRIRISVDEDGESEHPIRLHVEDDGPGIPIERRSEVLKPFVSTKPPTLGSGLGLSIVKKVIDKCLGRLELVDSELGGLKVSVSFHKALDVPTEASIESLPPILTTIADFNRVCVIDDDPVVRELISQFFKAEGIETIELPDATGVESLLKNPENEIDILVMDLDLPRMTGVECLTGLRDKGIRTPCVLMTGGFNDAPSTMAGMQLLRKPFSMSTLKATCGVLVNERSSSR
ncbi:MAG: ATP-binding protein [Phycisphaerales bacterium]|nr:ATP-binding protein [Phycisphaerales bacterium]